MEGKNKTILFAAFIVLLVAKLYLIADQEIFGQKFDDMGYALSMIDHYYGTNSDLNWQFIRPVGFPLFGAIAMESGIPYRIFIEVFYIASAFFLSSSLLRLFQSLPLSLISLATLVFHPWTFVTFNQILTEPLYLSQMLILVGISLRLLAQSVWTWRNGWLWGWGFLMAWMMLTRREGPWMMGLLLTVFLLHFIHIWAIRKWSSVRCVAVMLLIFIPVLTYQACMLGVSYLNYKKWGIYATNEQQAPGFEGLLNTLYKIDTPDPSIWAPVTSETLRMAMEVSPEFARLRDGMFDQHNPHLKYGEASTGREGELGAWMWWRLYDSLAQCGIYTSPKAANDWMLAVSEELEAAMDEGRLPKRSFSTDFPIDPNIQIWLPELPRLFIQTLNRLYFKQKEQNFLAKEADIPALFVPVFNEAANRRTSIIAENSVQVRGSAFSETGRLDFIAVENHKGEILAATAPQGYAYWKRNAVEHLTGKTDFFETAFYLQFLTKYTGPLTLSLWKDGQKLMEYPLESRPYPHHKRTQRKGDLPAADLSVTAFSSPHNSGMEKMRILLRGWAYTNQGPVTHISMVNEDGQFLKVEPFRLKREDIHGLYLEQNPVPPPTPIGFHFETPVLDLSAVTVQFWQEKTLVHELPLDLLESGYWGTLTETQSGIYLTLGIGRREMPAMQDINAPIRQQIRALLLEWHYSLVVLTALAGLGFLLLKILRNRLTTNREMNWLAVSGFIFLSLFLLGRAGFYGLVEAAVVPDVRRYMECATPLSSLWLVWIVFLPGLLTLPYIRSWFFKPVEPSSDPS